VIPALICCTVVIVAGLAHHAVISSLDLRERERLSSTDREALNKRLDDVATWQTKVNQHMANARPAR
jgi:hypothetical protein